MEHVRVPVTPLPFAQAMRCAAPSRGGYPVPIAGFDSAYDVSLPPRSPPPPPPPPTDSSHTEAGPEEDVFRVYTAGIPRIPGSKAITASLTSGRASQLPKTVLVLVHGAGGSVGTFSALVQALSSLVHPPSPATAGCDSSVHPARARARPPSASLAAFSLKKGSQGKGGLTILPETVGSHSTEAGLPPTWANVSTFAPARHRKPPSTETGGAETASLGIVGVDWRAHGGSRCWASEAHRLGTDACKGQAQWETAEVAGGEVSPAFDAAVADYSRAGGYLVGSGVCTHGHGTANSTTAPASGVSSCALCRYPQSSAPSSLVAQLTTEACAEDLLTTLAALFAASSDEGSTGAPTRLVFIGHSAGGAVAARAAQLLWSARSTAGPALVLARRGFALGGVICLDTAPALRSPQLQDTTARALQGAPTLWPTVTAAAAAAPGGSAAAAAKAASETTRDEGDVAAAAAAAAASVGGGLEIVSLCPFPDASAGPRGVSTPCLRLRAPVLALRELWPRWFTSLESDLTHWPLGLGQEQQQVNVLLIWGSQASAGLLHLPQHAQHQSQAAVEAVSVPGGGHWLHETEPVAVAVRVLRFLDSHSLVAM